MIEPLECIVAIELEESKETSEGGIVLPDSVLVRDKLNEIRGKVVAIGDGAWVDMMGNKKPNIGDKVFFAKHAGIFVTDDDGKEYRLIYDKDIMAIIRET